MESFNHVSLMFDEMIEDVKYIKKTTFLENLKK